MVSIGEIEIFSLFLQYVLDPALLLQPVIDSDDMVLQAIAGQQCASWLTVEQQQVADRARDRYIAYSRELFFANGSDIPSGVPSGIPYQNNPDFPCSVQATATVLSNLLDMGLTTDHDLVMELIQWLVDRHQQYWDNPELREIASAWQKPDNLSYKIFLTVYVAAVLSRVADYGQIRNILDETFQWVQELRADNGSLLGVPQSTWMLTSLLNLVRPEQIATHLQLLRKFAMSELRSEIRSETKSETKSGIRSEISVQQYRNTLIILRQLEVAAIDPNHPVVQEMLQYIEKAFAVLRSQLAPATILSTLLVLSYANRI